MRDIEKKAMALLNASEKKMGLYKTKKPPYELPSYVALYLSIEQHEAFKQEVSDVVYKSLMSIWSKSMTDHAAAVVEALEKVIAMLRAGHSPEDLGDAVILIGRMMARRT